MEPVLQICMCLGVPEAWAWRPLLILVEQQSRREAVVEIVTVGRTVGLPFE